LGKREVPLELGRKVRGMVGTGMVWKEWVGRVRVISQVYLLWRVNLGHKI